MREVVIFIIDYFIYCSVLALTFWAAKLNSVYVYLPNTAYGVILAHCLVNILNTMVKGNMLDKSGYDFIRNIIKVFTIKSANVQKVDKDLVGYEPDEVRNNDATPNINLQNNLSINPNEEKVNKDSELIETEQKEISTKPIVIICAGEGSLHERLFVKSEDKPYELIVIYYGNSDTIHETFQHTVDYYFREKGIKFNLIWRILEANPELKERVKNAEYVQIMDDDLLTDISNVTEAFEYCRKYNLSLAQPSLTKDSYIAWKTLSRAQNPNGPELRYLNSVEIMMPIFSKQFFNIIYDWFEYFYTGYHMDMRLWSQLILENEWNCAVLDRVSYKHTRPFGKGELYTNTRKIMRENLEINAWKRDYKAEPKLLFFWFLANTILPKFKPDQIARRFWKNTMYLTNLSK